MEIREVTGKDLPANTTHGFKIIDDNGKAVMFFHWHEESTFEMPIAERIIHEEVTMGTTEHRRTSYADVLAALPDRLEAMGYDDEIVVEVVNKFGAG